MTKPPLSLYRELIAAGEKALWIHSSGVIHVLEHNTVLSWTDCLEIVTSVHHQQGSLLLIFKLQWYNWLRGSTVGGFYQDSEKGTCSGRAFSLSFHLSCAIFTKGRWVWYVSVLTSSASPASFPSLCDISDLLLTLKLPETDVLCSCKHMWFFFCESERKKRFFVPGH